MLSGLYSNSLMVILNSRIKFSVQSHSTTWKDGDTERNNHVQMLHVIHSDTLKAGRESNDRRAGGVLVTVSTQEEMVFKQVMLNTLFRCQLVH